VSVIIINHDFSLVQAGTGSKFLPVNPSIADSVYCRNTAENDAAWATFGEYYLVV